MRTVPRLFSRGFPASFPARISILAIVLLLILSSFQPVGGAVINRKISGAIPDFAFVIDFRISPDGRYVVFTGTLNEAGKIELFRVPLYGGQSPVRLNQTITYGGNVRSFEINSLSDRVVYIADANIEDRNELFSVPLEGGTAVRLNSSMTHPGGDVRSFKISPDGQMVAFLADPSVEGRDELYSVAIDGHSNPEILNDTPIHAIQDDYLISPNNNWVVFRGDTTTSGVYELYSNYLTGGVPLKLDTGATNRLNVTQFQITPNSAGVVFMVLPLLSAQAELYSNAITGAVGGPYELSDLPAATRRVANFAIAPDSLRVVYNADQEIDNKDELFVNSIFGGDIHKLSGTISADTDVNSDFSLTTNTVGAQGVVYRISYPDLALPDAIADDLFSNYLNGIGGPYKLNTSRGMVNEFAITNGNTRVVYRADQELNYRYDLYSVPIVPGTGLPPLTLSNVEATSVIDFKISPNGAGVVYRASETSLPEGLFMNLTAVDGNLPLKLNGPLVPTGRVSDYQITPDNKVVVYRATQDFATRSELYISFIGSMVFLPVLTR